MSAAESWITIRVGKVCEASARGLTLFRTAMELRWNSSLNNVLVMPAASSAETAFSS
jgi:hypothetical protein